MENPQSILLKDGRLWLNHGPIDLFIEAQGHTREVELAYQTAIIKFENLLAQIVEELPQLRKPVGFGKMKWKHQISKKMENACLHFEDCFITPMAAVAGSVADTIIESMVEGSDLKKAYVNNGGDISIHLSPHAVFSAAIAENSSSPDFTGSLQIDFNSPSRGIATSGWAGRSFSLGIADSVTVLAKNAAIADAAATMIANAVDVDHPAICRKKAETLDPDSDLRGNLVTIAVGHLPFSTINEALDRGIRTTQQFYRNGLIDAAFLSLQGQRRIFAPEKTKRPYLNPNISKTSYSETCV
ncbi:MAG: UPF0280 family protein [SAR324 cluster bacterium]|nr:UPF0280 family protein [SAR324 cluster bacterium]